MVFRAEPLEPRISPSHSIGDHIHPRLSIVIEGTPVEIPSNIGITATQHFNPHTHDTAGTLHVGEGPLVGIDPPLSPNRFMTLKDFFDVWRTTGTVGTPQNNPNALFSSTQILENVADATHVVTMTVNGTPNTDFENFVPHDGDQVVISYVETGGSEPTANTHPAGSVPHHIHWHLQISIDGQNFSIPASVGHTSPGPLIGTFNENAHTHTTDGIVHFNEGTPTFLPVEEFITTWGAELDPTHIKIPNPGGGFTERTVDATHTLRFLVNGADNVFFENYEPEDGDQILISYETIPIGDAPTLGPINNITMAAGKSLPVPLDGFDHNGDPLSYTFTSDNPNVTGTFAPATNQGLRLSVSGKDIEGNDFSGNLVFQLYDDLTPDTVARIVGLVNAGFYDTLKFHRVVNDFVAQGGDPLGTGSGGTDNSLVPLDPSLVGKFEDEYDPSTAFTGFGQLAMANSGDDTNDSQFFITDTNIGLVYSGSSNNEKPPQHLNFQHSIFGQLVEGFDIFQKLILTPVTGSTPVTNVVINDAIIFTDNQNAVLRLSSPATFNGSANVTVTATGPGGSAQRSFVVTVLADDVNDRPFIHHDTVNDVTTTQDVPASFPIPASDLENDILTRVIRDQNDFTKVPPNVNVFINSATGQATLTPLSGFVGTVDLFVGVRDQTARDNAALDAQSQFDTEKIRLFVGRTDNAPTLQFNLSGYTVNESGGTATATVTRTGPTTGTLMVDFATMDDSATAGSDYTATTGTLTFAPGDTTETFTITITNDAVAELPETIFLKLSNPTGGAQLGTFSSAVLTVQDNETAKFEFDPATYTVAEHGSTATITIVRKGANSAAQNVSFSTADGSATAGNDYTAVTNSVIAFAAGETKKTVTVTLLDDVVIEGNETVTLKLSNPSGGATVGPDGTMTIADTVFQFSAASFSVAENVGNAVINLTRTGDDTASAVNVQFDTSDGTATAGDDYTTVTTFLVSFAATETTATVTVPILEDTIGESPETINLTLSNPSLGGIPDGKEKATLTITDNDPVPSAGSVQFSLAGFLASESGGSVVITVTRTGGTTGPVTVDFATSDGTAISGSDYVSTAGTLTFAAADTQKTFTVFLVDDTSTESAETVNLTLSNLTGGAIFGTIITSTLTINDNDAGPANNNFINGQTIAGDRGTVVSNSTNATKEPGEPDHAGNQGGASIWFVWSATADGKLHVDTSNTDFDTLLAVYTGAAVNALTKLDANDDASSDLTSSLFVPVTAGTAYRIAVDGFKGAEGPVTLNWEFAPSQGAVEFFKAAFNASETGPVATITVRRVGGETGTITVDFATNSNTPANALENTDYTKTTGTLTFLAGETIKTFTVPITDDPLQEGSETFNLALTNPTGGAILGAQATATVAVTDNDNATQTIWKDTDGDLITAKLGGGGALVVAANDFGMTLTATTAKSKLNISIKKALAGNGQVNVANITALAALGKIKAPTTNLTGAGVNIAGAITSIAVRDVLNGADVIVNGTLGSLAAAAVNGATINVNGDLNTFSASRLIDSNVFAGFTPADPDDLMNGGSFSVPLRKINSVQVTDTAAGAFDNSVIAAAQIGKVKLGSVETANGSTKFGVLAKDSIGSVTSPPLNVVNPAAPSLNQSGDFQVKITANSAPNAVADSYQTDEETPLNVPVGTGLLANDTDADNHPLTAILVLGPSSGDLTLNTDGSFLYTPQLNASGPDSFTYRANDGSSNSAITTVSITINPINDSPVAVADNYATTMDTPLTVVVESGVLQNDSDVDNNPLTAVKDSDPAGTLTFNTDGSFNYTPPLGFVGTDTFTYHTNDGTADSAPVLVSIIVA